MWRKIEGYEGFYEIEDYGRVRRLTAKLKSKYPTQQRVIKGKILKNKISNSGYLFVILSLRNKKKPFYLHDLVAKYFLGKKPIGFQVNHINGNKKDNRKVNLEYLTPSDNQKHSARMGLWVPPKLKGEDNGRSKLTEKDVLLIRYIYASKYTQKRIAYKFNVSRGLIGHIIRGKSWQHL